MVQVRPVKDTRTAQGLVADDEYLAAARYALDYDGDTAYAIACALIVIAETLDGFRHTESGFAGVVTYPG